MYKDRPKIKLKEHSFQFNCYFVYIFCDFQMITGILIDKIFWMQV